MLMAHLWGTYGVVWLADPGLLKGLRVSVQQQRAVGAGIVRVGMPTSLAQCYTGIRE